MPLTRFDQPLGHRNKESACATRRLNGDEAAKIAINREPCEIENQVDDPTTSENLAVFAGLVNLMHLGVFSQPQVEAQLSLAMPVASGHRIPQTYSLHSEGHMDRSRG